MKKRIVFICFFLFSLVINIIPLFVFKDKVAFSALSIFSALAMIGIVMNGIQSYLLRHKANYISFCTIRGITTMYGPDREITFTEEYSREFYWQFVLYWFAVPFYIPCIFFGTELVHFLWTVCVVFVPQTAYLINDIVKDLRKQKEIRRENKIRKQELEEQRKREELRYFK